MKAQSLAWARRSSRTAWESARATEPTGGRRRPAQRARRSAAAWRCGIDPVVLGVQPDGMVSPRSPRAGRRRRALQHGLAIEIVPTGSSRPGPGWRRDVGAPPRASRPLEPPVAEQLGVVGAHDHRRTIHRARTASRPARGAPRRSARRAPPPAPRARSGSYGVLVRRVTGDAMVLEAGRAALLVRQPAGAGPPPGGRSRCRGGSRDTRDRPDSRPPRSTPAWRCRGREPNTATPAGGRPGRRRRTPAAGWRGSGRACRRRTSAPPPRASSASSPGSKAHSGSQNPADGRPKYRRYSAMPIAIWARTHSGVGRQERQDGMRGRGREELDAPALLECAERARDVLVPVIEQSRAGAGEPARGRARRSDASAAPVACGVPRARSAGPGHRDGRGSARAAGGR